LTGHEYLYQGIGRETKDEERTGLREQYARAMKRMSLKGAIVYMLVEEDEGEVAYMVSSCPNDIDCWVGEDDIFRY